MDCVDSLSTALDSIYNFKFPILYIAIVNTFSGKPPIETKISALYHSFVLPDQQALAGKVVFDLLDCVFSSVKL